MAGSGRGERPMRFAANLWRLKETGTFEGRYAARPAATASYC
jgi:hypothetical protein